MSPILARTAGHALTKSTPSRAFALEGTLETFARRVSLSYSIILIVSLVINISDIDECDSLPCENGGRCVDGLDVFTCQCSSGYTGKQCETSESLFAYNCTSFYPVYLLFFRYQRMCIVSLQQRRNVH